MRAFFNDIKYAFRRLQKNPGFTVAVVLILGLGIGAATSVFSIANGVLLRALPYKNPDRLVMLFSDYSRWGIERGAVSGMNFLDWKEQNQCFEDMAVLRSVGTIYQYDEGTDHVEGLCVSPNLFTLLGWEALVGRTFGPEETWPNHAHIVLGYDFWQRRLQGDTEILGKAITLGKNEKGYTVVGIMPPGIRFLEAKSSGVVDFWIPVDRDLPEIDAGGRGCLRWNVVGQLKPGVGVKQAQAEMDNLAERIAMTEFPDPNHAPGIDVVPLHRYIVGDTRPLILLAGGASSFVLVIACANAVTLILVRALGRRREMATRIAFGSSLARLFRQAITESMLLSLMGGILGILLARNSVDIVRALVPSDLARLEEICLDSGTLIFTLGIILFIGIMTGLIPAWNACRIDVNEALKADVRGATPGLGRRRLVNLFIASQVSLSLMLLIGSALLINSLIRLLMLDPGYRTENILTLELENLPRASGPGLLQHVKAMPGVRSAALVNKLPLCGGIMLGSDIIPEDKQGDEIGQHMVTARIISPGYFHAMGIPFLSGRDFTEQDNQDAPDVTIINENLARRFWPRQDPIGKQFEFGWAGATVEIVGVVRDIKSAGLDTEPVLEAFLPLLQQGTNSFSLVVTTESKPTHLTGTLRHEIRSVDVNVVIRKVRTMRDIVAATLAARRFLVVVLSVFSILAVVLASFGLYGIMSHLVRQRRSEIGIRMALGASTGNITANILCQGCKLTFIGVVFGLIGAFALTRTVSSFLYDVSPTDPLTFACTSLLLIGVALLACYVPAKRAAKIDPMEALRYE